MPKRKKVPPVTNPRLDVTLPRVHWLNRPGIPLDELEDGKVPLKRRQQIARRRTRDRSRDKGNDENRVRSDGVDPGIGSRDGGGLGHAQDGPKAEGNDGSATATGATATSVPTICGSSTGDADGSSTTGL